MTDTLTPTQSADPVLTIEVRPSDLVTLLANTLPFIDKDRPALSPKLTWDPSDLALHAEATDSYVLLRQSIVVTGDASAVPAWSCQLDTGAIKSAVTWLKACKLGGTATATLAFDGKALTLSHPAYGQTSIRVLPEGTYPNTEALFKSFTPNGGVADVGLGSERLAGLSKIRRIGQPASDRPGFKFVFGKTNLAAIKFTVVGDSAYGLLMPYRVA